jgi:hypothetical protein
VRGVWLDLNTPTPEPAELRASILGEVRWRPTLRSRNGVYYLTCRSWLADAKAQDLAILREAKRTMPPELIADAAHEMTELVRAVFGEVALSVVPVACGHSRRIDCMSVRLAEGIARSLDVEPVQAFAHRFMKGSSHPLENRKLPPLKLIDRPAAPALVVDDIATSGFHMHEALTALRSAGVPAFGIAWLGGVTTL